MFIRYWGYRHFGMGYKNSGFVRLGCRYQNCYTTANRKFLKYKDRRIDAVMVHHERAETTENQLLKLGNPRLWSLVKRVNQDSVPLLIWINKEPMLPEDDALFEAHPDYARMFNVTVTYKGDSTVVLPYGRLIRTTEGGGSGGTKGNRYYTARQALV